MPSTFFDDDDLNIEFQFTKAQPSQKKDLQTTSLIAGTLNCVLPLTNAAKRGMYALHNHLLVNYETDAPNSNVRVLDVTYARLKVINSTETNPNYGFKLTKNDVSFEFYSPTKPIIENWIKFLKLSCVLTNFHDEFAPVKTLGRGGFAKVCLVESKKDGAFFAVKGFSKKGMLTSAKEKAKPSLLNEIALMRKMNHSSIVKIYEVHETENSIYLLMELIKGKTLHEFLNNAFDENNLTDKQVKEMIRSILVGLAYIAAQGIMHRDLKPANILVGKNQKLKIADFGLATPIKLQSYIFKKCGTPGYMAPEVFKYKEKNFTTFYDDKCDVFSAGCILFFMLFGFPFFNGLKVSEINGLNQKYDMNFKNIDMIQKELNDPKGKIDKSALNLLLKLLEVDPNKRPTAAQALEHPFLAQPQTKNKIDTSNKIDTNDAIESPKLKPTLNGFFSPMASTKNHDNVAFTLKEVSAGSGDFVAAGPNRCEEKDSLYLNMGGKSENLAKSNESLHIFSGQIPVLDKEEKTNTSTNSLSHFASPTKKKDRTQTTASPKSGAPTQQPLQGSLFLKAAIFNNMQKHNEVDKNKELRRMKTKHERHNTEHNIPYPRLGIDGLEERNNSTDVIESSEVNEFGNEHEEVNDHIIHKFLTTHKFPGTKTQFV